MPEHRSQILPSNIVLVALSVVVTVVICLSDLLLPLGVAAGIPYVLTVLLGAWLPWRHSIVVLAIICTILTTLGYFLSPAGGILWVVLLNRTLALLAIWTTAILLLQREKVARQLKQLHIDLESRIVERTAEAQEHKAFLHGIMDNITDGLITIDEHGIIDSFNHTAELMFGYTAEHACGQNISILMPDPYQSQHDSYISNYLKTGKGGVIGIGHREVLGQHRDGPTFPLDLNVSVMKAGGKRRFIGNVRDITQRKETEKQLQQAQKMEAIGHLTGGIAHDFNNMLTAIIGNIELAKEFANKNSEIQKYTDLALRASFRAANLTQRLLAFSRKQALQPEVTDVNGLVPDMAELMRRSLGERVEIEIVLSGGLWPAIVDKSQLENALLNLAINARDAMPDGGKLTIETANTRLDQEYAERHEEVSPGQYVMIAVTDNGTGMPPEVIDHVFEPFYTTKEIGKGSGLGLSMVYGFLKQSGGHIKIYSEVEQGTTIKLYLPKAMSTGQTSRPTSVSRRVLPRGNETILVVEDDYDVRTYLIATLKTLGYHIMEAEDGPTALALLEDRPSVDLLLTDVVMPKGMSGRHVADEVRKLYPEVRVLFTSGYTENAIVHQGRLDEDAKLLAKPYTKEVLAQRVRTILDAKIN